MEKQSTGKTYFTNIYAEPKGNLAIDVTVTGDNTNYHLVFSGPSKPTVGGALLSGFTITPPRTEQ